MILIISPLNYIYFILKLVYNYIGDKMLEILKYVFLGIIQGLTEPLPISSSGHVFILRKLFDLGTSDLNFEIIVNFGSLIAILLIYRKDIIRLVKNFFKFFKEETAETKRDFRYCLLIIIGSIPIGLVGVLFKDQIEEKLNNIKIIGISFLITALFLFIVSKIKTTREEKDMNIKDAIIVGLSQVIAVIPGISRSGSTLIGGIFRKLDRKTALKYSFMLYIPVSLGTTILGIKDIIKESNLSSLILPYTLGFIASLAVSYFTLRWFIKIVNKGNLKYFSIYCLILGLLVLIFM